MALSAEEQRVLDELLARKAEKPPRTRTGIAGVLHELLDVVSGAVAHLSADRWAELHDQAEALAAQEAANAEASEPVAAAGEAGPVPASEPAPDAASRVFGTEGTGFAG